MANVAVGRPVRIAASRGSAGVLAPDPAWFENHWRPSAPCFGIGNAHSILPYAEALAAAGAAVGAPASLQYGREDHFVSARLVDTDDQGQYCCCFWRGGTSKGAWYYEEGVGTYHPRAAAAVAAAALPGRQHRRSRPPKRPPAVSTYPSVGVTSAAFSASGVQSGVAEVEMVEPVCISPASSPARYLTP
eukprot:gene134-biopygen7007